MPCNLSFFYRHPQLIFGENPKIEGKWKVTDHQFLMVVKIEGFIVFFAIYLFLIETFFEELPNLSFFSLHPQLIFGEILKIKGKWESTYH